MCAWFNSLINLWRTGFLQAVFINTDHLLSPWSLVKYQPLFRQMAQTMWEAIRSNPTCCFSQQSILQAWVLTGNGADEDSLSETGDFTWKKSLQIFARKPGFTWHQNRNKGKYAETVEKVKHEVDSSQLCRPRCNVQTCGTAFSERKCVF